MFSLTVDKSWCMHADCVYRYWLCIKSEFVKSYVWWWLHLKQKNSIKSLKIVTAKNFHTYKHPAKDRNLFCVSALKILQHVLKDKHLEYIKLSNVSEKHKLGNFFKEDNRLLFGWINFYKIFSLTQCSRSCSWPLFRKMFLNCDVMKQHGYARRKTTA